MYGCVADSVEYGEESVKMVGRQVSAPGRRRSNYEHRQSFSLFSFFFFVDLTRHGQASIRCEGDGIGGIMTL
jgi:hypothetical protein